VSWFDFIVAEAPGLSKVQQCAMNSATLSSAQRPTSVGMKSIVLYVDFLSPDARLDFERLPQVLRGWSYCLTFKPVQRLRRQPLESLSLPLLAVACDAAGTPNRYVCETIFQHVLAHGDPASDAAHVAALSAQLAPVQDVSSERVAQQLKAHSAEALALGLEDVTGLVVDGQVVRGLDALSQLRS
jgi:2-hydroxychromene-2-carboxylate isomerase